MLRNSRCPPRSQMLNVISVFRNVIVFSMKFTPGDPQHSSRRGAAHQYVSRTSSVSAESLFARTCISPKPCMHLVVISISHSRESVSPLAGLVRGFGNKYHRSLRWEDQCEWHRMTRMTGPDCAVMCNLINTHTHTPAQAHGWCFT